ncbi:MAG: hypothetical protein BWX71_02123 [Deltaproteobacteria bacterium ADurb.Bin072]|nr:MAG: hypothetical protein BWX71_02123 [Deltaproteobacteria bacterium ADurb.Bin072]
MPLRELERGMVHGVLGTVFRGHLPEGLELLELQLDEVCSDAQEPRGFVEQHAPGQVGVPLGRSDLQRVDDPGTDTLGRVLGDARLRRDAVRGEEPHARDVHGQAVGIGPDHLHGVVLVPLEDPGGKSCRDALAVEEHEGVPASPVVPPCQGDGLGTLASDARDLTEPLGGMLDDGQGVHAEGTHYAARELGADLVDFGGEIGPDAVDGHRRLHLELHGLELQPVPGVPDPGARELVEVAGAGHGHVGHHGHGPFLLTQGLDPGDGVARVLAVIAHVLDDPGDDARIGGVVRGGAFLAGGVPFHGFPFPVTGTAPAGRAAPAPRGCPWRSTRGRVSSG